MVRVRLWIGGFKKHSPLKINILYIFLLYELVPTWGFFAEVGLLFYANVKSDF